MTEFYRNNRPDAHTPEGRRAFMQAVLDAKRLSEMGDPVAAQLILAGDDPVRRMEILGSTLLSSANAVEFTLGNESQAD